MNKIDLDKFNGFQSEIKYQDVMDEYAEKCLKIVKEYSPKGKRKRYASGWVAEASKRSSGYEVTIWNKTDWQLTHLLENGHLIVNKRGGVGWASAHEHIQKSFNEIKDRYVKAMEDVKVNIIAK